MIEYRIVRLSFISPIKFQNWYMEMPWKISSDYIIRALTFAYSKLYDFREWYKILDEDLIRVSSMFILLNKKIYFPNHGIRAYVSTDGDIIDINNIIVRDTLVRISRDENIDATPYDEIKIMSPLYKWGVILGIHNNMNKTLYHRLISSFKLLGDIGIGGRKSRGGGRFEILGIEDPDIYGVKIGTKGTGKLITRYIDSKRSFKVKTAGNIYLERIRLCYGPKKFKELTVISEGSNVDINDDGYVDYILNDLSHQVPLYFRPLIVL